MNILVIGNGGREHALAWKVRQSPLARRVFVAPGNGGTHREPGIEHAEIGADQIDALLAFARDQAIDLTIVGPEAPLVAGIADAFAEAGLRCFGPRRAAARLEGSKVFTKDFLARHGIPTADYRTFTDSDAALDYLDRVGAPIVVKADGLAAGKGVTVAQDRDTAARAIRALLDAGHLGTAGRCIVLEQLLHGEEASFIVAVDGDTVLPLASSQDHKARDDGDQGPNTGGMGAYSPAPVVTPAVHERVLREIIAPTLAGLRAEGIIYRGFLYAGLMIADDGTPRLLEYNCRLGDPETQPLLLRLRGDLVELCRAGCDGQLDQVAIDWDPRVALGVVLAAGGYPGEYRRGDPIDGLDALDTADCKVFHAGTRLAPDGRLLTDGGRLLCVTALGDDVTQARALAYAGVDRLRCADAFCRRDIGQRALNRSI